MTAKYPIFGQLKFATSATECLPLLGPTDVTIFELDVQDTEKTRRLAHVALKAIRNALLGKSVEVVKLALHRS